MLEWNVCKECGKILDNSQKTCQSCNGEVEKVHMDYLSKNLADLNFLVRTLSFFKDFCPSLKDLENVTLKSIIYDDLLNFFGRLGLGDDVITDNELEFINSLLNASYTADDISAISKYEDDEMPLSFRCLSEMDSFAAEYDMDNLNLTSQLYSCYNLFGKFFITVDNMLDDKTLSVYKDYIAFLKENLTKSGVDLNPEKVRSEIPQDVKKEEETHSLEEYLDMLNKLVGLEKVKKDVNSLINLVQIRKLRQERGIKQPSMSLHLVFSGNPGTGKTTVARLLSKIYHEIGLLSKGHLVETDRSGLVAGYVGQTAIKTQEMIQSAMGGILFIDEAYALAQSSENDYGKEAIDTLLKAMEDNRDDLIIIVAGYPDLMDNFLNSNPGLESRFNKFIFFEDYDSEELYKIFLLMCSESELVLDERADEYAREYFNQMYEHKAANFANGRAVRNFFEEVLTSQANRLALKKDISDEELSTLTYEDFLVDDED